MPENDKETRYLSVYLLAHSFDSLIDYLELDSEALEEEEGDGQ